LPIPIPLQKSIDSTNTNTFQTILLLLIQQSQVYLTGGPAGCAFFLRRCGSQLQQCVKILHATYFLPQVNKKPPYVRLYITKTAKWSHFFRSPRLL